MKLKKIAVVMGGLSNERPISLESGKGVVQALKKLGYNVKAIDLDKNIAGFVRKLNAFKPDIVFNALHGKYGEDGNIQGLLNMMHIPYTHSGVIASAIGMDKNKTREVAKNIGVPIAKGGIMSKKQMQQHPFPMPYVAKPNDDGSSLGVHIIRTSLEHKKFLTQWNPQKTYLLEEYIPGRELSVAVLNNKVLGSVELVTKTGFYDYKNKYTNGQTQHLIPAPLAEKQAKKIAEYALAIHQALGCRGVSRSDFRYDDTDKRHPKIVFLEINTNPGMTPLSLVPDIAKNKKISYDKLVVQLLKEAQCD